LNIPFLFLLDFILMDTKEKIITIKTKDEKICNVLVIIVRSSNLCPLCYLL